jgi:transcription-repair coupling factor (superfamily II helicase)
MKDLEIRGAGDLLGGEQSGFINEIGFDTYQKIMNEAIEELKENEFKDLYEEENDIETKEFVKDFKLILILNCCFQMNTSTTLRTIEFIQRT